MHFCRILKAIISIVMSLRLSTCLCARNISAPTEQIFMKFDISVFFFIRRKLQFHQHVTRMMDT